MFPGNLKLLFKNPMAIFVYGIASKWYIMIAVAAMIVAFWVLKGLTEAGVLQAAEKVVSEALHDTKSVARYCTPKITDLGKFWHCLQNPPKYEPTKEEKALENDTTKLLKQSSNKIKDPFAE